MDALDESPDGGKFKKESNINMKKKWKKRNEVKSGCLSCMSCVKDASQQETIYRCVCILASYLI